MSCCSSPSCSASSVASAALAALSASTPLKVPRSTDALDGSVLSHKGQVSRYPAGSLSMPLKVSVLCIALSVSGLRHLASCLRISKGPVRFCLATPILTTLQGLCDRLLWRGEPLHMHVQQRDMLCILPRETAAGDFGSRKQKLRVHL